MSILSYILLMNKFLRNQHRENFTFPEMIKKKEKKKILGDEEFNIAHNPIACEN